MTPNELDTLRLFFTHAVPISLGFLAVALGPWLAWAWLERRLHRRRSAVSCGWEDLQNEHSPVDIKARVLGLRRAAAYRGGEWVAAMQRALDKLTPLQAAAVAAQAVRDAEWSEGYSIIDGLAEAARATEPES